MTYTSRNNGQITDFWPDNDDETIYIESIGGISIPSLIQIAQEKWPNISLSDIEITSEKIHTHCITYDLYDAGDWTEFVVIKKTGDTPAEPQELIQSRLEALEEGAKRFCISSALPIKTLLDTTRQFWNSTILFMERTNSNSTI